MPEESQLTNNFGANMYGPTQNIRVGQKLIVPNRVITKLRFLIGKSGGPTGDVAFSVYRNSDKALLATKVWGDASGLAGAAWKEVDLDDPLLVNDTAIIMVEFSGGNSSNYVFTRESSSDVKANENDNRFSGGAWENNASADCAYVYTYEEPAEPAAGGGPAALVAAGII